MKLGEKVIKTKVSEMSFQEKKNKEWEIGNKTGIGGLGRRVEKEN